MSTTSHTTLKGFDNIGQTLLNTQLEHNLISFFNWGLLEKGGYFNSTAGTTDHYSTDPATLRLVTDPHYTDGRVWEGRRIDWVWESGIPTVPTQPIDVSGVIVDDTFYPSGDATYSHVVDYPNGRIIFDTAVATTSTVKATHSSRYIHFTTADNDWFNRLVFDTNTTEAFGVVGSGERAILGKTKIQLPAVVVEALPTRRSEGLELGQGQIKRQDIAFYVFAESSWERNNIIDYIDYQNDKTIFLYDINGLLSDDIYPLNADGSKVNNNNYPDFVNGDNRWKKCRIIESSVSDLGRIRGSLFSGAVRQTARVDMPEL